jgi:hypothetical protein
MAWRGVRPLTPSDVAFIPGMMWFLRLIFHAAWSGKLPTEYPYWPFASAGVSQAYFLIVVIFHVFGP